MLTSTPSGACPSTGSPGQVSAIDFLVRANRAYADAFRDPGMDARPVLGVAVVACMDARIDLHAALGLELGDCHTIRNAGGVVTDDTIRSLTISQRALNTRSVVLIHHTGCGLQSLTEEFRYELSGRSASGRPGQWSRSGTSTRTYGSRCGGCIRRRSCRTPTT